jgi:glutaredoxin
MGECTIKYEFIDVDMLKGDERKAIIADVKKFNPRCSFPTIIIGEKVIIGFKEKEIKEALGM